MTINIGHLYYDLLNLYGESGNIKALKNYFEEQNIKVNIKFITIDDKINLDDIDIIYIGSGTENNQKIALNHLLKYKKEIKNFIENEKFAIITGNSIELFGKTIITKEKKYNALNIFDYNTNSLDFRIVDEALFKSTLIKDHIIGFQNQNSIIKDIKENNLFEVKKGIGSYPKSQTEGYHYKNFYGTYLIGPLLVRNPKLLEYIGNKIIKFKNNNYKIKKNVLILEKKAYNSFINNYYDEYK